MSETADHEVDCYCQTCRRRNAKDGIWTYAVRLEAEIDRLRSALAERDATIAARDERIARFEAFAEAHKTWATRIPQVRVLEILSDKDGDAMIDLERLRDEAMKP